MTSAGAATFVYIGNGGSQDITVAALADDGGVRLIETVAMPSRAGPGGSAPLATSPDRQFLFAAVREPPCAVATYRIDATTGRLAYVGSGPLAASMAYISTDGAGRFLFGASYHESVVTVSPIAAHGVVGETLQTIASAPNAHAILAAPSNRFVLHTSLGGDVIHQHRLDPETGRLSPNDPPNVHVEPGAGPRHLVFSPDGRFVYLLNELDGSIYVFPYDAASGTLAAPIEIARALPEGFAGTPWAADIHVTPDGRFLYASERTSSTLAAFRVEVDRGMVTALGSWPTATQPRAFAIDPAGRYLLAAGQRSNSLTSHAIDPRTGALTRLAETPVGEGPSWIEIVRLAR